MLRFALLALLARGDRHGYELKAAFEELLGGTWALNIGQVYTTLSRLERDGFVSYRLEPQEQVPDRKVYSLTPAGWRELTAWMGAPADQHVHLKEEGILKLILHSLVDAGDVELLLWQQRRAYMQTMAELSAVRDSPDASPATQLVAEAAMLHLEADLRWLDLCEGRLDDLKPRIP